MKEKITRFIRDTKTLLSLEGSLYILRHNAEKKQYEQALVNLTQACNSLAIANKNLLKALQANFLSTDPIPTQPLLTLVEQNIAIIAENIQATEEAAIPHKEELSALISSCAATLTEKEITNIFNLLKEQGAEFSKQIILLEDLCLTEVV